MSDTICLPPKIDVKPPRGSPCNGCGWCCAMEPCGLAREFIGEHVKAPCPALERRDGRFVCGLILRPSHYLRLPNDWADEHLGGVFADALGVGKGCDADDPDDVSLPTITHPEEK